MRLLFVHERFGAMAGAEVNAYLTAVELKERGHALGLIHGAPTGKAEAAWGEVFEDRFALAHGMSAATVHTALRVFRPDVVYIHKMADLQVLEVLADSRVPLVRMVHDHDLYCMRSYKYHPLTRNICTRPAGWFCIFPCLAPLLRNRNGSLPVKWASYADKQQELRINRRFDRMVVASEFMKQELLRNGFEPHRIEIHAPVPRTDDSLRNSSFSERNLLIYAGQVIRGKGVDVLLRALALLTVPFECVILGEGSHRAHCERLCEKLNLQTRVQFKGYVPPEQLQGFYSDASVAVMSSVWPEPFGAVGLEAMRYGLPVVAFDAGGVRDWLVDGHNGFLVPRMDRAQFATRIEQLLRDKTLARKLGEHGRRFAREKFNFATYIDGLEAMFSEVADESQLQARP